MDTYLEPKFFSFQLFKNQKFDYFFYNFIFKQFDIFRGNTYTACPQNENATDTIYIKALE